MSIVKTACESVHTLRLKWIIMVHKKKKVGPAYDRVTYVANCLSLSPETYLHNHKERQWKYRYHKELTMQEY